MKILLLGPQGSGKGTVGKMMSDYYRVPIVSTGHILRSLPESHPRKKEVVDLLARGELVPQDLVAQLLGEETSKEGCLNGFIFDGWGRAMIDLEYFDPGFDCA